MDSFLEQWIIEPHIPDSPASLVALFFEGLFLAIATGDILRSKFRSGGASLVVASLFLIFNKYI